MTVEKLAAMVIDACEAAEIEHMVTGAFAYNRYGIPRSTKDIDMVLDLRSEEQMLSVIRNLDPEIEFDTQVQFDTLTWGKRHVGVTRDNPPLKVELFALFDDPFILSQFSRRKKWISVQIERTTWLPTPEDVIVQKLRWGRPKDLDDARDVLAVQGLETLDMGYIENWCAQHDTSARLAAALDGIPPLGDF